MRELSAPNRIALCVLALIPACLMLAIVVAAAYAAQVPSLKPGDYEFTLQFGGRDRSYLLHLSPAADGFRPLPLVFNFHGGGSNAQGQRDFSRMNPVADRNGFIAVYPNGTGILSDRQLTWDAGTCCGGYAQKNGVDDVGFTFAVLDDVARRTPVDRSRVYATGYSNGAMMVYRLAAEAADRIAAIAIVSGSMVAATFHPARPMPIMHIHSVNDAQMLYHGLKSSSLLIFHTRTLFPDVETVLAQWREFDKCPAKPDIGTTITGKPGTPDEGNTATKYTWGPCAAGTEIVLWKLSGSGHVWPGGMRVQHHGRNTGLIDANEEMWRFFSKFSLPPK
jgi:polyhydroxybutyrate depolymerase